VIFTPSFSKSKPQKKKKKDEEEESEESTPQIFEKDDSPPRVIGICGELDEEKSGELMYAMITLAEHGVSYRLKDPEDEDAGIIATYEPFEFIISTLGGNAQEMFALHDLMRVIRDRCDICTVGLGKVFSAGTLLLASGTPGKRKIGKNCRVMVHSVVGGNHGNIHSLENEMDEIRVVQEKYINAMVQETNMTKRHLKKILDRKVNAYFTAEEAVELGIADTIL